jgi:hypothetical protein
MQQERSRMTWWRVSVWKLTGCRRGARRDQCPACGKEPRCVKTLWEMKGPSCRNSFEENSSNRNHMKSLNDYMLKARGSWQRCDVVKYRCGKYISKLCWPLRIQTQVGLPSGYREGERERLPSKSTYGMNLILPCTPPLPFKSTVFPPLFL